MRRVLNIGLPLLALVLVAIGGYWGLVLAPTERMMGDVYRIMFVHVPSAMMALLAPTVTCFASLTYLLKSSKRADALAEASAEACVVLATLCLATGSIWGKPTWGVWWTWDPRLTSVAILWIAFIGYFALRKFVDDAERRATWSAVTAIIISVDVPITYFSVKWWNSLHQMQSNPNTVSADIAAPLRLNITAYFVTFLAILWTRYRIARDEQAREPSAPSAPSGATVLRRATS
ncbi:MAG: cytochrome c biogenesis protein CcsA [Clostridia bacterium]|nr:cytochrome c biogenesis protein CcsA [Deltaproteobacteria bacterium]